MSIPGYSKNLAVFFLVLAVVAVPMLVILAPDPRDQTTLDLTLRITARVAFLLYIAVFITRPLRQLLPAPFTRSMLRNRRYLGISFSAVMTGHLLLISWLLIFVSEQERPIASLVPGIITYVFVFLMLLTSFDGPAQALGSKNWRRLHKTGLYWIGIIFAITLVPDVINYPDEPLYLAIGALIVMALVLRIAAFVMTRRQSTEAIDSAR